MATANQEYFDRPESIRIARGEVVSHNPEANGWQILGPKGELLVSETNGGILQPRPVELARGITLIRFGNAPFADLVASGSWWLDWINYKRIETFADKHKIPVATAMRHLCAVPVEWSSMTMLIQASVRSPLSAYAGPGNIAAIVSLLNMRTVIDPAAYSNETVEQLYIPGLSSDDLRKESVFINGTAMLPAETSQRGYDPQRTLLR